MQKWKQLWSRLKEIERFSKNIMAIGTGLCILFYIISFVTLLSLPYVKDYHYALSVYRGCLQMAPPTLAIGLCGGILSDLMIRRDRESRDGKR